MKKFHQHQDINIMALTTELSKRLDDEGQPLSKRLCLSQNVFLSSQLPVLRKEEFVIVWLTKVASEFRKKSKRDSIGISSDHVVDLWCTLQRILSSAQMQRLSDSDVRPSAKASLVAVLSKHLGRKDWSLAEHISLIECVISLLESSSFRRYFRTNIQSCMDFISLLFSSLSRLGEDQISLSAKGVETLQAIGRQTYLKSELCIAFLDVALVPLIKLSPSPENSLSPLGSTVSRCIQQVLFPKTASDFFQFFEAIFSGSENAPDLTTLSIPLTEEQHPVPFKFFKILENARNHLDSDSYVKLFVYVYKAFVISYRLNNDQMVFKMTVTLCYILGFEVKNPKLTVHYEKLKNSLKIPDVELSMDSLRILHGMCTGPMCASNSVAFCSIRFFDWLEMLVGSLFPLSSKLNADISFMELMSALLKLNPVIVQPHMKSILSTIFAKPFPDEMKPHYVSFVCNLLAMYIQLRRVPTFVTLFLGALKEGFKKQHEQGYHFEGKHVWLPLRLSEELTQCSTLLPSASSIASLNTLLNELLTYCLEDDLHKVNQNDFLEVFTECTCELTCAILRGVRMLEQCVVPSVRQNFCNVLKQLKQSLGSLGRSLLKHNKPKPSLVASFLNLSHCWAAEALIVEQYAEIGREELLESLGIQMQNGCQVYCNGGSLSLLHPYLTVDEWTSICNQLVGPHEDCKELLLKLRLQILFALRMFSSSSSSLYDSSKVLARSCCELMVDRLKNVGQVPTDRSLVYDMTLIVPLLSFSELVVLSDSLAVNFISNQYDPVVKEILTSLLDNRLVACGLICSTLSSLRRVLKTCKRKKGDGADKLWKTSRAVLGILDAEIVLQAEVQELSAPSEQLNAMLSSMAAKTEKFLSTLVGDLEKSSEKDSDLTDLSNHIHFLRSLPLPYLSVHSQGVVFISLLSVALDCTHFPQSAVKDSILKEIFDHLLFGFVERGVRPQLEGFMDYGILLNGLAFVSVHNNVAHGLVESLLVQGLRGQQSRDQVLEKMALLSKKSRNQEPMKESLLLGTLLMAELCGWKKMKLYSVDTAENSEEIRNRLIKVKQKLAKSFEALFEKQLVSSEDSLLSFALTLDFSVKFDEGKLVTLTPYLDKFCQRAISFLKSDIVPNQKAAETFILVVLRHRSILQEHIPAGFVRDIWALLILSVKPNNVLSSAVFESATTEEITDIVTNLLQMTQFMYRNVESGATAAEKLSPNLIQLWQTLLSCQNLPANHREIRVRAMRSLFERLPTMKKLSHQQLLEFLHSVLTSDKLTMDMEFVDLCFLILHEVTFPQNAKDFAPIGRQYVAVLSDLLLRHSSLTLDSIPSFLQVVLVLIKQLSVVSKQSTKLSRADGALLAGIAYGLEKLVDAMTKRDKKKSFKRVAGYLIADIVGIFEVVTLCSAVKVHFQNMVYSLLSIVDDHSNEFLVRTLSPASTEIFKSLLGSYKKFYQFSGKV